MWWNEVDVAKEQMTRAPEALSAKVQAHLKADQVAPVPQCTHDQSNTRHSFERLLLIFHQL